MVVAGAGRLSVVRRQLSWARGNGVGEKHFRVLYFTRVPLVGARNGGLLCCRNSLETINADPSIDCFALVAAPPALQNATQDYFAEQNITGRFVPYVEGSTDAHGAQAGRDLPFLMRRWPVPHEIDAWNQRHLDTEILEEIKALRPDCIVVDYLPSGQFVPSAYRTPVPVITITLNREADFYRDQMALGGGPHDKVTNAISHFRLRLIEAMIHRRSRAVVSIGKNDLPGRILGPAHRFWNPPSLEMAIEPWRYSSTKSISFVGNRGHFPNALAMEWIATQLAPILANLDPSIMIKVVGALETEIPAHWRMANVNYLGLLDDDQVRQMFRSEDLFIAPIANNFGAKFKVAEAISFSQPLLATEGAMSGVSFLPWLERIDLSNPGGAAKAVHGLIHDPAKLLEVSRRMNDDARRHRLAQATVWSGMIARVMQGRHESGPERASAV
jgi:hypothetical protein